MSQLDEAFFKAYEQTDSPPTPTTLGQSQPIPLSEALGRLLAGADSADTADLPEAVGVPVEVLGVPVSGPSCDGGPSAVAERPDREPDVEYRPSEPPKLADADLPGPSSADPPQEVESPAGPDEVASPFASPQQAISQPPASNEQPCADESTVASVAEETVEQAEPCESALRPMLQVDAFAWPAVLAEMTPEVEAQLDATAAALVQQDGRRPTVVALAGSTAKAGCTTLLLGAAARLARRGLNVVLVDANEAKPGLSSSLHLLPSLGWEDIVAGREPLAEVLIESVEDRLSLLPLSDPDELAQCSDTSVASMAMASAMATLRQHYDLVLVDLGTPQQRVTGAMDETIDAAVLVHDVRRATDEALLAARRDLAARRIVCAGVIENFASPGSASVSYRRAA